MDLNQTILVVDDEQFTLQLLKRILEGDNYKVLTATSGDEALKILSSSEVHMVLLDIRMPGMNGYETLERIREKWNIPVIMATAVGEVSSSVKSLTLGADDYIRKPFSQQILLSRVRAKLRRAGSYNNQNELN
ncbi:MAG: response regulator [Dehalococcoidales bacterium]|nr:response regulator [Dehalococcoidales bacterium]